MNLMLFALIIVALFALEEISKSWANAFADRRCESCRRRSEGGVDHEG